MEVVRHVFRLVGSEKRSLHAVTRTLRADGVPSPSGNEVWLPSAPPPSPRRRVQPHTLEEIAGLVAPQVAGRLDPGVCYGVWWFNRERWTSRQVSEVTAGGHVYRRSVSALPRPKEDWVAVPVPSSGVPREVVDTAREAVLGNRWNPRGDAWFLELSGASSGAGPAGGA